MEQKNTWLNSPYLAPVVEPVRGAIRGFLRPILLAIEDVKDTLGKRVFFANTDTGLFFGPSMVFGAIAAPLTVAAIIPFTLPILAGVALGGAMAGPFVMLTGLSVFSGIAGCAEGVKHGFKKFADSEQTSNARKKEGEKTEMSAFPGPENVASQNSLYKLKMSEDFMASSPKQEDLTLTIRPATLAATGRRNSP